MTFRPTAIVRRTYVQITVICARFGDFVLDGFAHELRRGNERIHLTAKVWALLELLIERRGTVVPHAEIHDRLWPDVVVSEANLKDIVSRLRTALDDHERAGKFLRSVHGCGYAFTADVVLLVPAEPGAIRAWVQIAERGVPLRDGVVLVGRGEDCAVRLDDVSVSRHHARFTVAGDEIILEDLGSKNGTLVDGERLTCPRTLPLPECHILFGLATACLTRTADEPTTKTAPQLV